MLQPPRVPCGKHSWYRGLLQIPSEELVNFQTKCCININRSTGHPNACAFTPSPSYFNGSSSARGYTKNHLKFTSEAERFQQKVSSSIPSNMVTVTIVLTQPETKGHRVVYLAIDAVWCFMKVYSQNSTSLLGSLCWHFYPCHHWDCWSSSPMCFSHLAKVE